MRTSVYIATSLDGFIARPDGGIDWLMRPEYTGEVPGLSYEAFMATVDCLVMGRHTYEMALTFAPWPYEGVPVVVLSSRELVVPERLHGRVTHLNLPPAQLLPHLAAQGYQHLYIDGGQTIQRFLRAGLINQLIITTIPLLLGAGLPLFGTLGQEIPCQLQAVHFSPNGLVQQHYTLLTP
jgi:dihydrofolate reductase